MDVAARESIYEGMQERLNAWRQNQPGDLKSHAQVSILLIKVGIDAIGVSRDWWLGVLMRNDVAAHLCIFLGELS